MKNHFNAIEENSVEKTIGLNQAGTTYLLQVVE